MRVVHTVASLRADHGGPSRSVTALASAQVALGLGVRIVTMRSESEGDAVQLPDGVRVSVAPRPRIDLRLLFRGTRFERAVADGTGERTDRVVLHDHGLWLPSNHTTARVARRLGVPRVVSVRGMLSSWALDQSRLRKRAAWAAYQRQGLASASLIHATSEKERDSVSRLVPGVPVEVVPNGVALPPDFLESRSSHEGERALFLSRLHPGKGLEELIETWATVRPAGWRLSIAGPGDEGYVEGLRRQVVEAGLEEAVSFHGTVNDEAKWDLYQGSDLFILPTHSENFGLVVAEALAAGVPVITTHGAPWEELDTRRCGWWVPVGTEPLVKALREATTLPGERLREMGARGRELILEKYTWDRVAEQVVEAYATLLTGR